MKKIISFEKKLEFPSMVGEITAISLDHTLEFKSPTLIEGAFLITGTYKLTEASCIEDAFNFKVPTEIMLTESIDVSTGKIEVDDFFYEIENEENLICHIDILVEGLEEVIIDEQPLEELDRKVEEIRECDGDKNKEIEIPHQEQREENEIGIHAIRGGTIPGEHTVIFAGLDEVIDIKHMALSKKVFAKGAVEAAKYIVNKENGMYCMDDLINSN